MRVLSFVVAACLCSGVAFAGGLTTDRLDNTYDIIDSKTANNFCFVGAEGTSFEAGGDVTGTGTGGLSNTIVYGTPFPTNASANDKKISVKSGTFSTLNFLIDGATVSGGAQSVEKCNVSGSVNANKLTGKVQVNCSGTNLNTILDANEVASFQTAFTDNKRVKIKTNQNSGKWSISITCNGDVD